MTGYPEAVLAAELQLPFAAIALVTDYDAGIDGAEPVSQDAVFAVLERNVDRVRALLERVIPRSDGASRRRLARSDIPHAGGQPPARCSSGRRRRSLASTTGWPARRSARAVHSGASPSCVRPTGGSHAPARTAFASSWPRAPSSTGASPSPSPPAPSPWCSGPRRRRRRPAAAGARPGRRSWPPGRSPSATTLGPANAAVRDRARRPAARRRRSTPCPIRPAPAPSSPRRWPPARS